MIEIDRIYFLNLDIRTDRWNKVQKEFIPLLPEQYHSKIVRLSGVDYTDSLINDVRAAGCAYSHLNAWRQSIDHELNNVLIFEDDVVWNIEEQEIKEWFEYFTNINFNMINLSYNYRDIFGPSEHDNLLQGCPIYLGSAYIAKTSFLELMYSHVRKNADLMKAGESVLEESAIDVSWNKYNFNREENRYNLWYQTFKKLVIQDSGFSDINKAFFKSDDNLVLFHGDIDHYFSE